MADNDKAELKDIGLGVNTIASRLTSIGVVGVVVVLFISACFGFWTLLRDTISENRAETKSFLEELHRERDRSEARFEAVRTRNEARHTDLLKSIQELTAEIKLLQQKVKP